MDIHGAYEQNIVANARTVTVALDEATTTQLLREIPKRYRTRINEVLLAAFATVIGRWSANACVKLDLEGHGREALFDDLDVSRTIGWFTSVFPTRMEVDPADTDPLVVLSKIKEQLRKIPEGGVGYGLLRELTTDTTIREVLRAQPPSELLFNYLGQTDELSDERKLLDLADEACGETRSRRGPRAYVLEINARITGGQLLSDWSYCCALHHQRNDSVSRHRVQ